MRAGVGAACAALGLAVWGLVPGAAPARAETAPAYVVMFSDGDWVGAGVQRLFDSGNARIAVTGSAAYVTVSVAGGTSGDAYDLDFAAPPGEVLVSGAVYTDAQRAPFREHGHAGIDIGGDGRGCNTISGSFEVKEIAVDASGAVTRLWIVYEQRCEGGMRALWGEVKIGAAMSTAPLVAPGIVRWPTTDVGAATTTVPVTVRALAGPVAVGGVTLTGAAASDFAIRANECTGKSLPTGGSCQVWIRFAPSAAGTRPATLGLSDTAGRVHDVALQGFAYGGRTRLEMTSDSGDYIGQGKSWSYSVANALIAMSGGRSYAGFGIDGADGSWWSGSFVPAQGDILVAGSTYPNATRYPFNGVGPGMDIGGNGRGCNTLTGTFTVTWADFSADGRLRSLGITFEQHCEGATPALRGTFEYRAGDDTPLAPWMIPSRPPPPQPPPPPTIASFAPTSGAAGTSVTITGTNLSGATAVTFGGVAAAFAVDSATQMTALVPAGAASGPIAVATPAGTATTSSHFDVTTTSSAPPPPQPSPSPSPSPPAATQPAPTQPAPAPADPAPGATVPTAPPTAPAAAERRDTTPPDTRIRSGPARVTRSRRAVFRFAATEAGATFECRLDRRRWTRCRTPTTFARLAKGRHRLLVRARDGAGNVDPTPALRVWTIR